MTFLRCRANCKQTCGLCPSPPPPSLPPPPPVASPPPPVASPPPTSPPLPPFHPPVAATPASSPASSPPPPASRSLPPPGPTSVQDASVGRPPVATPAPANCTAYTWITGEWGPCNATCGFGLQNRTVNCFSYGPSLSLGSTTTASHCNAAQEPIALVSCIVAPCPADYSAACHLAPAAAPAANGRRLFWWY